MTPARINLDVDDLQLAADDLDRHQPLFTDLGDDGRPRLWTGTWDETRQAWVPDQVIVQGDCPDCLGCANFRAAGRRPDTPAPACGRASARKPSRSA